MTRWTKVMVLTAAMALAACGPKNNENNENNTSTNNTSTNNTSTNNTSTNNTSTNNTSTNNTSTNNTSTNNTNNMTTGPDPTCANYCTTVMANCTGDDEQFGSEAECLDYCNNIGGWETGTSGDTDGNSIACRIYHGGVAANDSGLHCPHAGPTGGNVCGTWCDNYCDLAANNCTGDDELYADDAACATACANFEDDGEPGDVQYDTVQCRIYHAGAPAATTPATHCPHAGETPTSECLGAPEDFNFRTDVPADYTRVDRVGMPAVSTALITSKNDYNDDGPVEDANGDWVAEIVTNLTALHVALDDDLQSAGLVECTMADTDVDGLPDCIGQPIVANGPSPADLVVPDTIKIDTTAAAGFPNGRLLADPVMDVTLAIILLDMTDANQSPTTLAELPLNPPENDLGVEGAFLSTFPYLHPPHE